MATKKATTKTTGTKSAASKATKKAATKKAAPKKASTTKPAPTDEKEGFAPQSQLTWEERYELDAKRVQAKKTIAPKANGKLSMLDAAAMVLKTTDGSMTCKELITEMAARELWTSPGGKTPQATLYSAILREQKIKGNDARFKKTERGKFAASN